MQPLRKPYCKKSGYPRRKKGIRKDVKLWRQPRTRKALIQKTCDAIVNGLAGGRICLVRMDMVRKECGKKKVPMVEVVRRLKDMGALGKENGNAQRYRSKGSRGHNQLYKAANRIYGELERKRLRGIFMEDIRKRAKKYKVPAESLARILDSWGIYIEGRGHFRVT